MTVLFFEYGHQVQRSEVCQVVSVDFELTFECFILAKCLSKVPDIIICKLLMLLTLVIKLLDGLARLFLRDQTLPQVRQVSHKSSYQATHFYSFLRVLLFISPNYN